MFYLFLWLFFEAFQLVVKFKYNVFIDFFGIKLGVNCAIIGFFET
ncbi:hypothetical protein N481_25165 [Pseudoalteromonas luteoviolacea S4047-1]|nr:hypothetical protein N481_25165 [Pseudoalteromonas luteoviolacea S4047-1]